MSKYNTVLFDLDGTLTDPGEGITNSVAHALEKFDITVADKRELYKFIGPPLWESFEKYYGFTKEQAERAVEYYREYFRDCGIFENLVYGGVPEMLSRLREEGMTLAVATSKPEPFAIRITEHYHLDGYFALVAGGTMDGSRTKKHDIIEYALDTLKITDRAGVIMVGDREHDIIGATASRVDSIGVLYGYGSREELENAGATHIAVHPADIADIILAAK